MPWNEVDVVKQRKHMIELLSISDANVSEICRRLNVSRKTAYKWLNRAREAPGDDLSWARDRSRRRRRARSPLTKEHP